MTPTTLSVAFGLGAAAPALSGVFAEGMLGTIEFDIRYRNPVCGDVWNRGCRSRLVRLCQIRS